MNMTVRMGSVWLGLVALMTSRGEIPAFERAWDPDLGGHYALRTATRESISLNGVWRIAPVLRIDEALPRDVDAYGHVLVPSSWMHAAEFPISGSPHFVGGRWRGDARWRDRPMADYPAAWYVREFVTPAGWEDRHLELELERCTIHGEVFLNGIRLGRQRERDAVRHVVNDAIRPPGETNQLAVRVTALLDNQVKAYLGGDETVMVKARASLRGITGDVWLHAMPADGAIRDVFVTTSVRQSTITFEVEVESTAALDDVAVRVDVFDSATGNLVHTFVEPPRPLAAGVSTLHLSHPWADAVLWEPGRPHLYQAAVSLVRHDKVLDAFHPVAFGFREVWIEDRQVVINGIPFYLHSVHTAGHDVFVNAARKNVRRHMDLMISAGFNSLQLGCEGTHREGNSAQYYRDVLTYADEKGIPAILPVFPVYAYQWHDAESRADWDRHVRALIRRYRNHPSLIIYAMNFNYLGYAWDLNPHAWADDYQPPDRIRDLGNRRREVAESMEQVRAEDASRLIYNHASGNHGDFITSNFYPCWPPIQELGDSLSGWAETGKKPLVFVELSLPVYPLDMVRARSGNYLDVRNSEVLQTEYLAATLGADAYVHESDDYLSLFSKHATTERTAGADRYELDQPYYWGYRLRLNRVMELGMKRLRPDLLRTWRTHGLSGFAPNNNLMLDLTGRSFEPWHGIAGYYEYEDYTAPGPKPLTTHIPFETDDRLTEAGAAMRDALKPVLIYFGGAEDVGFSSKDHAWFAGERIDKQLVVVNDTRRTLDTRLHWRLLRKPDGARVAGGDVPVRVAAGRRGFHPVSVTAPEVDTRTEYVFVVTADARDEQTQTFEDFAVEVFPRPSPLPRRVRDVEWGLFDPSGETAAVLGSAGLRVRRIDDGSDLGGLDHLIVGRGALSPQSPLPENVIRAVVEQGATLLCLEQRDLSAFSLRLHPRGERVVFPLVPDHPAMAGLTEVDLRNWRGAVSLTEPYPADARETPDLYPEEFWKWGNRGVVVSHMIEKPPTGGLLSLAECGFDLAYTPLAEFREGRGRVLLSQMETTLRYGKDPAATQLLNNLLQHAASPATHPNSRVERAGGLASNPDLKAAFGQAGDDPANIIMRSGRVPADAWPALIARAAAGATVILVGQEALADLDGLPVNVRLEKATYYRASPSGTATLTRGIGFGDLFLKDRREDWVVPEQPGVNVLANPGVLAEVPHGAGRFVLVAIDPEPYRTTAVTPERSRRIYGKLLRVLTTLAINLGAASEPLSGAFLQGFVHAPLPLPDVWRFSTDPDNTGVRSGWHQPDFDDQAWSLLDVPGYWENQGVTHFNPRFPDARRPYDGFAWYRCSFALPERFDADDVHVLLGAIDDLDVTYFNGRQIGQTGVNTPDAYSVIRNYPVPRDVLRPGAVNTIAVRVFDAAGMGGMTGPVLHLHRGSRPDYPYVDEKPVFNPYRLKRW